MLPESLKELATPAAIEARDPSAITGGSHILGETTIWISPAKVVEVCRYLKQQLGFIQLTGVTCIDRHPLEPRFEVLYLLNNISKAERIKLKVALSGDVAEVDSVTCVWEGADWYEREAFDLFGVRFNGHPDLRRIMMPDNWEGHPLRKDFPVHGHKYSYQNE